MKLEKLNFGSPLSRDEQKQIKGGSGSCNTGQGIYCQCNLGGATYCAFATYDNENMNDICGNYCLNAYGHYNYVSRGSGCGQCGGNP